MPYNPVVDGMWVPGDDDDDDDEREYEIEDAPEEQDLGDDMPEWWEDDMPRDWLEMFDEYGWDYGDYEYEEFEIGIDYGEDT